MKTGEMTGEDESMRMGRRRWAGEDKCRRVKA